MRPWSQLPDLVLYSILMHINRDKSATGAFVALAFSGVCTTWRSIAKAAVTDFLAFHERRLPKELLDMHYVGQSCGYMIMQTSWRAPVVLNPLTGDKFEFPDSPRPITLCCLSAPPTSPDCVLWLVTTLAIHWCRIGGYDWCYIVHRRDNLEIKNAVVFMDKLYLNKTRGQVEAVDMEGQVKLIYIDEFEAFHMGRNLNYRCQVEAVHMEGQVLVKIGQELWMVVDRDDEPPLAYRLNLETNRWVARESLGAYAVFLIAGGCTAEAYDTTTAEGVIMENCIYVCHFDRPYYSIESLDAAVEKNYNYLYSYRPDSNKFG